VKHVGPYGPQISQAFETLGGWAMQHPTLVDPARMMAIYNNSPQDTPEDDLDTDAAIALIAGAAVPALPDAMQVIDVPGGRHAVYRHVGPYDQLSLVWPRVMRDGVAAGGLTLANRAPFDWYRNNPRNTPSDALITDICLPLAE